MADDFASMDDSEFLAEMRGDYLENIQTELEDCEKCLMKYEKAGDGAELEEFKRLVHSSKGGARMVALNELSNFLHGLESKLAASMQQKRMKEFILFALPLIDQLRAYAGALRDGDGYEPHARKVEKALSEFK